MFKKIKDKLKNVFEKSEEVVEEGDEEIIEEDYNQDKEPSQNKESSSKTKKSQEEEDKEEEEKPQEEDDDKDNSSQSESNQEDKDEEESSSKDEELSENLTQTEEETQEIPQEEMVSSSKESEESLPDESKSQDLDNVEEKKLDENQLEQENEQLNVEEKEDSKLETEKIQDEEETQNESLNVQDTQVKEENESVDNQEQEQDEVSQEVEEEKSEGFFSKTFKKVKSKKITEDDFEKIWLELEIFLLEINVAFEIVEKIGESLKQEIVDNSFSRFGLRNKIKEVMKEEISSILEDREADFNEKFDQILSNNELVKIMVLGVNGSGKTTSIAKLISNLQQRDYSSVVSASDTFRAASVEQLEEHTKKLGVKLVKHKRGSDPAAVAYDAIEHAKAKKLSSVIIDTAGRMPNEPNLMEELVKIKRISQPDLIIFVGDSTNGNDLVDQIHLFDNGVGIDGVILTKVDTDERPGSVISTAYSIDKPIYFLGTGQNYQDFEYFNSKEIAEKLLSEEDEN